MRKSKEAEFASGPEEHDQEDEDRQGEKYATNATFTSCWKNLFPAFDFAGGSNFHQQGSMRPLGAT